MNAEFCKFVNGSASGSVSGSVNGSVSGIANEVAGVGAIESTVAQPRKRRMTQQRILLNMIEQAQPRYIRPPFGEWHVQIGDRLIPVRERGGGMRLWVTNQFLRRFGEAPSNAALAGAITAVLSHIQEAGECASIHRRIARTKDAVYHHLNPTEAVEITANGWRVIPLRECPVLFSADEPFHPLPRPVFDPEVSLHRLGAWMHVASPEGLDLIIAWLIGVFSDGPYPHLLLTGPSGSSKSTAMTILHRLIDPGLGDRKELPDHPFEIGLEASRSVICCYDNVSFVPQRMSDALCRLSDGASWTARRLYTNADMIEIFAHAPAILTSIDDAVLNRGDVMSRTLVVSFNALSPVERRPRAEIMREVDDAIPTLLGALYNAVSCAMRNKNNVRLSLTGRLADFQRWAEAAAPAVGWKPGYVSELYLDSLSHGSEIVLQSSALAQSILHLLDQTGGHWSGLASHLLDEIKTLQDDPNGLPADLPKTPNHMTAQLRRLIPEFERCGVSITLRRTRKGCVVTIRSDSSDADPAASSDPSDTTGQASSDPPDATSQASSNPPGSHPMRRTSVHGAAYEKDRIHRQANAPDLQRVAYGQFPRRDEPHHRGKSNKPRRRK